MVSQKNNRFHPRLTLFVVVMLVLAIVFFPLGTAQAQNPYPWTGTYFRGPVECQPSLNTIVVKAPQVYQSIGIRFKTAQAQNGYAMVGGDDVQPVTYWATLYFYSFQSASWERYHTLVANAQYASVNSWAPLEDLVFTSVPGGYNYRVEISLLWYDTNFNPIGLILGDVPAGHYSPGTLGLQWCPF